MISDSVQRAKSIYETYAMKTDYTDASDVNHFTIKLLLDIVQEMQTDIERLKCKVVRLEAQ